MANYTFNNVEYNDTESLFSMDLTDHRGQTSEGMYMFIGVTEENDGKNACEKCAFFGEIGLGCRIAKCLEHQRKDRKSGYFLAL